MLLWPLAAFSLLSTRWSGGVPAEVSALAMACAAGIGLWSARRGFRAPRAVLELLPERQARWRIGAAAVLEGRAIAHEQWPVITVRFVDGGTTIVFWPDTLCHSGRRALRRWARSAAVASPLPQFWMG